MLFKVIGGSMIVFFSTFIGYILSLRCSKRPHELKVLQNIFQMLENEFKFMQSCLVDAFTSIIANCSHSVAEFFKSTIKILTEEEGISACCAWERAVHENLETTSLNKEDQEILISFGKMLGISDLEGQIKNLQLTIEKLKIQELKAEENKKSHESMYKNLGFLCGMAVVIIIM